MPLAAPYAYTTDAASRGKQKKKLPLPLPDQAQQLLNRNFAAYRCFGKEAVCQISFFLMQPDNFFFNSMLGYKSVNGHRMHLAESMPRQAGVET